MSSSESMTKVNATTSIKELIPKEIDDDALNLAQLGYVQAYKRKYNLLTAIGFTIGVSGTWEGMVGSIGSALSLGGPVSLLYGFIFGSIGMCFVAASLAELSSIYPTSGGQYHWAAMLAPKKIKTFISWTTAWTSLTTEWICVICSAASVAVQVQAYAQFANEDYSPKRWHVTMIYWLVLGLFLLINIFGVRQFQYLNSFVIGVHIIGYLLIIIVCCALKKDFNPASYAFGGFSNTSGWPDGLAWCVGILTTSMGFLGIETAVHFAEEIHHASVNVPRAIFFPVLLNSIITIPFLIFICFIVPSADTIFSSPISGNAPSIMIWYEAVKNIGASIFLNSLGTSVAFVCGVLSLGSAGRMTYAMARDQAIPQYFTKVNDRWEVAIPAQISATGFPIIIGLIYIWNSTALYGVMAGVTLSYQLTYFIPISLTFGARKKGLMDSQGEWKLGKYGYFVNGVAFFYLLFTIIFLSFPTVKDVDAATMNYATVLVGFGWFMAIVMWFTYGKKHYKGPGIESAHALEVVTSARSESQIDGVQPAFIDHITSNQKS